MVTLQTPFVIAQRFCAAGHSPPTFTSFRIGRAQSEGYGLVGMDLRRNDRRQPRDARANWFERLPLRAAHSAPEESDYGQRPRRRSGVIFIALD